MWWGWNVQRNVRQRGVKKDGATQETRRGSSPSGKREHWCGGAAVTYKHSSIEITGK